MATNRQKGDTTPVSGKVSPKAQQQMNTATSNRLKAQNNALDKRLATRTPAQVKTSNALAGMKGDVGPVPKGGMSAKGQMAMAAEQQRRQVAGAKAANDRKAAVNAQNAHVTRSK